MEDRLQDHPLRPFPKLIINCALTGMVPTKSDTSCVPVTPEEIASDAIACANAGATIVHVHARDEDGKPTYRKDVYREIIERIREAAPELVICVSTSGRKFPDPELRGEVLDLRGKARPDMASLTLGSFNFPQTISPNPPQTIHYLAERMAEKGIKPELEAFEAGMINYGVYLLRKGLLKDDSPYFNLILGSLGTSRANVASLHNMLECLPIDAVWSVGGVGRFQLPITTIAIALGGGVRVGIEDTIYYDYERTKLATNEMLVKRVVRIAKELGRELATPEETRSRLGLQI